MKRLLLMPLLLVLQLLLPPCNAKCKSSCPVNDGDGGTEDQQSDPGCGEVDGGTKCGMMGGVCVSRVPCSRSRPDYICRCECHTFNQECCEDADCPADPNPCYKNICDLGVDNKCMTVPYPLAGCCKNADCKDDDECTQDKCVDGECKNPKIPGCPWDGGVWGEPHIKPWKGHYYDYHGECDLVMLNAPHFASGLGMTVQVRTTIRTWYSLVTSAAIRIGDDVLQVDGRGHYALNHVEQADLSDAKADATLAGFPIYYNNPQDTKYGKHIYDVVISPHHNITITTSYDFVHTKLRHAGNADDYKDSVGLLGSFPDGLLLARNGTTVIEDPNQFGQEWQVREDEPMLFLTARPPQQPSEQCKLPSPEEVKASQRRLRASPATLVEAAEKACAHWKPELKEACIFDVLETGDLEMAEFY